jgi:hypothetical protein
LRWPTFSAPKATASSTGTRAGSAISCPKCQAQARERWLVQRQQELLPASYFHVVFTLPGELSALVLQNQRALYDLLFRTVAATLLEVAADPKHLGAEIGFFGILHTWGQNLLQNPHS